MKVFHVKTLFLTILQLFELSHFSTFFVFLIMVDSVCFVKLTPIRALMYPFNTLQVCYRHIVNVHEEFFYRKMIFDKFTSF